MLSATVDTIALSVLSLTIAVVGRLFADAIETQPSNAEEAVELAGGGELARWGSRLRSRHDGGAGVGRPRHGGGRLWFGRASLPR